MTFPGAFPATGCLLAFRRQADNVDWHRLPEVELNPAGVKGWSQLMLTSSEPLLNEVRLEQKYAYPFLLRQSGGHLLFVGTQAFLVDYLLMKARLKERFFSPAIDVAGAVQMLSGSPNRYVMSALFSRVEAEGPSLRSMSLYGSDVGDSRLFRRMLSELQPYRVTLRRVESGQEVISVGSRGEIGFPFTGKGSLSRVDAALKFLATQSFIHWETRLSVHLKERR